LKIHQSINAVSITHTLYLCSFDEKNKQKHYSIKSVNLQNNTPVRWADGTNDPSTKLLMFHVSFFFHKILQNSLQKPFQFIFLFFHKITKMKIKSFEFP